MRTGVSHDVPARWSVGIAKELGRIGLHLIRHYDRKIVGFREPQQLVE